jgi:hypothetical protein
MEKRREIMDELRLVLTGRGHVLDTIVPLLIFLITSLFIDDRTALWGALAAALGFFGIRLIRRQSLLYALGGLAGIPLAFLISYWLDSPEGFFLPGMVTGGLSVFVCLVSALAHRPAVALTSHVARRWPLKWYWHPQVRPAYEEVTYAWAVFFGLRLGLEVIMVQNHANSLHTAFNLITGWPFTIGLLIVSYIYGLWRLKKLMGPSVDEFINNTAPPWTGQLRGF